MAAAPSLASIFCALFPTLDQPVQEYMSGVLDESNATTVDEVYEAIGDQLVAYDAAADEAEARTMCQKLIDKLSAQGLCEKKIDPEAVKREEENKLVIEKFAVGRTVLAFQHTLDLWNEAEIRALLPDNQFTVFFPDSDVECQVKLSEIKLKQKSVRLADIMGADFKGSQSFTDFVINGVRTTWRADLGVEVKNSEAFYLKTQKQERKEAALKRKEDAREARMEAMKKEQIMLKKRAIIQQYLAHAQLSNNKNIDVPHFVLQPPDGGQELVSGAALRLLSGRRYGLIGRNGVGKTCLLSAMAAYEIKDFPKHLRVMHVEQEAAGGDETVIEHVLAADAERDMLMTEEKRLNDQIEGRFVEKPHKTPEDRLEEIHIRLNEIDAFSADSRACAILFGLGFTAPMLNMATRSLSGGWRMRVALAAALFVQPDVLLLDEPTNHLDFPAVLWLEDYLQTYANTLLVVSHDRNFVNNVITDVIHFQNQSLTYYRGDYTTFERVRMDSQKLQAKQFEAQQKQRQHVQGFIDRFRYNANRAALVQSRIKALERMELLADVADDPKFTFTFPPCEPLQKPIVLVNTLTFGYRPEKILLENIDLRVDIRSRIGIVGGNGVGKSTLIKLIMNQLTPLDGWVEVSGNARVTCFSQHHVDQLNLKQTPLDFMCTLFPSATPLDVRKHLGRFGVTGDLALQTMGTLSGGQKSRVAFSVVTFTKPHLLILDEPTNHLDLETVDALIMAINQFEGGVMAVSHDQHLLCSCIDEFWAIHDRKVKFFDTFETAKAFSLACIQQQANNPASAKNKSKK